MPLENAGSFYWFVTSKATPEHNNDSNYSFSTDLPVDIEFNHGDHWMVGLAQICVPSKFVNVNNSVSVAVRLEGKTTNCIVPQKSYPNLSSLVGGLNTSIAAMGMEDFVKFTITGIFCTVTMLKSSPTIVELSENLRGMLGFSGYKFSFTTTSSGVFQPLYTTPYLLVCSETLLNQSGDSSQRPLLKIIPLLPENLTKPTVYTITDRMYLDVRTDYASRLTLSCYTPDFNEFMFEKPLNELMCCAILHFYPK